MLTPDEMITRLEQIADDGYTECMEISAELRWLQKQLTIAEKKNSTSLANNLCPDHRDKQHGKPCLACEIERLQKENAHFHNFFAALLDTMEPGEVSEQKLSQAEAYIRGWEKMKARADKAEAENAEWRAAAARVDEMLRRINKPEGGREGMAFTRQQVEALNSQQCDPKLHPYTCGNCRAVLLATENGWRCPVEGCGYVQTIKPPVQFPTEFGKAMADVYRDDTKGTP